MDGVPEALAAGRELGLRVVPGIEISAELEGGTLHVLGYGFDMDEPRFAAGVTRLKQARDERNPRIIENLQAEGIDITLEKVAQRAGGVMIGRPHMARTLLEIGAVGSIQEAFDEYLGSDARAYVHKFRYPPAAAFALIRGAGGIPVMAHPYQTRRAGEDLRRLLADLKAEGLEGIEVHYSRHTPEQTAFYRELASEFDLVETGGTDFHGATKADIALGRGQGDLCVPVDLLEPLDERIVRIQQ